MILVQPQLFHQRAMVNHNTKTEFSSWNMIQASSGSNQSLFQRVFIKNAQNFTSTFPICLPCPVLGWVKFSVFLWKRYVVNNPLSFWPTTENVWETLPKFWENKNDTRRLQNGYISVPPTGYTASYSIKCNMTMPSMASTVISCTQSKTAVIHSLYVKG